MHLEVTEIVVIYILPSILKIIFQYSGTEGATVWNSIEKELKQDNFKVFKNKLVAEIISLDWIFLSSSLFNFLPFVFKLN